MRRSGRGALALPMCTLAVLAALAQSAWGAPNPPGDIRLSALPRACERAPTGAACEAASVRALDAARANLALGPYLLPADFLRLAPARQWLILANLDRIAYARVPISGLSRPLDVIAMAAARANDDPDPRPALRKLNPAAVLGTASAWAGGLQNGLLAYYGWMYDDGYGSGNLDCRARSDSGCWGHRQNILAFSHAASLSMGAAAIRGAVSYALTVVETSRTAWPYSYTWAAAMADGAGAKQR